MDVDHLLREAIERRKNIFQLATATISIPSMREAQKTAFNQTIAYKAEDFFQRPIIQQFRTHTQLILEDAQANITYIADTYEMTNSWKTYIQELRQQLDTIDDLLSNPTLTGNHFYQPSN